MIPLPSFVVLVNRMGFAGIHRGGRTRSGVDAAGADRIAGHINAKIGTASGRRAFSGHIYSLCRRAVTLCAIEIARYRIASNE